MNPHRAAFGLSLEAILQESRKLVIVCGDSVAGLRERLARSHSRPGAVGRGRKVLSACPRVPSSKLTTARPTPISASTRARLTCLTPLHGRQHDNQSDTLRWSWSVSTGSVPLEGRRRADRCVVAWAPLRRCACQAKGTSELSVIHLRLTAKASSHTGRWCGAAVLLVQSREQREGGAAVPVWACMGNARARAPHLVSRRVTASA